MKKLEMIECEYVCDILLQERICFLFREMVRFREKSPKLKIRFFRCSISSFFHSKIFMCYPTLIQFRL